MTKVKFAIPKGHLGDQTLKILERAGYRITGHDRTYRPGINDPEIELKVLRPQEIPTYVSEGVQDVGISGKDWVAENKADVETLLDLEYAKVRLVIAVSKMWSEVNSLSDLIRKSVAEGSTLRISTEYLNAAKEYIKQDPAYKEGIRRQRTSGYHSLVEDRCENERVAIYLSFGATEAKPPEDADAIVEVIETGTSLQQNGFEGHRGGYAHQRVTDC